MKQRLLQVGLIFLLSSCNVPNHNYKFNIGDKVCFKGGGPIGVVSSYVDPLNDSFVAVTFYTEPKEEKIQIGVGGSLIGGDGIVNNRKENYMTHVFVDGELIPERECLGR